MKETYHRNFIYDILAIEAESKEVSADLDAEIDVAEILTDKIYICRILSRLNIQIWSTTITIQISIKEEKYAFDITKADQIFDHLSKDK